MDRIVQIQMLHHRRDVRRVMVHIVPLANLIGAAMTPTIDSDDPEPFGKENNIWLSQSSALNGQP